MNLHKICIICGAKFVIASAGKKSYRAEVRQRTSVTCSRAHATLYNRRLNYNNSVKAKLKKRLTKTNI